MKKSLPLVSVDPETEIVRTSIYISRKSHECLRKIAFDERKRVHNVIVEGIDTIIQNRGYKRVTARVKMGFGPR